MHWTEAELAAHQQKHKTSANLSRKSDLPVPMESEEQKLLVQWLDYQGLFFTATANGGKRHIVTAKKLKAEGVKPGVADILIFDAPPKEIGGVGVAIELKRSTSGKLSEHQVSWLKSMDKRGWLCYCVCGAEYAISLLTHIYFGKGEMPCSKKILQIRNSED